ncbi:MAG: hypothetical protein IJ735_07040 [Clostridia bacterium]|nr:hypothetical protein [Clostridia bacterium]
MKKRLFFLLLAISCFALIIVLASCGDSSTDTTPEKVETPTLEERVYRAATELGYTGTLEDFLALCKGADGVGITAAGLKEDGSLYFLTSDGKEIDLGTVRGEKGEKGADGKDGANGKDGRDGIGIKDVRTEDGHLIVTLTDETERDLGNIVGADGDKGEPGQNGRGIERVYVTDSGDLFVVYTDDDIEVNVGKVIVNGQADPSQNPSFSVEIDSDGFWVINGKTTEVNAIGKAGKDGVSPTISINEEGYWVIDGAATDKKAVPASGADGNTPTIEISAEGYWVINGTVTDKRAVPKDGKDGKNGSTSTVSLSEDGYWVIDGKKTEVLARGTDGKDGQDGTNGTDGKDGVTPTISIDQDCYWVINGNRTDVLARGTDGKDGRNGTNGTDGKDGQNGTNGKDGLSAYEIYCKYYPEYTGSEKDWIDDLVAGRLSGKTAYAVTIVCGNNTFHQTVEEGEAVDMNEIDSSRTGYVLTGWTVNGESYSMDTPVTAAITINAVYAEATIDTYTEITSDFQPITVDAMTRKRITLCDKEGLVGTVRFAWSTGGKVVVTLLDAEQNVIRDTTTMTDPTTEWSFDLTTYESCMENGGVIIDVTYRADEGDLTIIFDE